LSKSVLVLMGVSGSGKSFLGCALAKTTGMIFIEGDDFHPAANRAKMAAGIALDDGDRWPWLYALSAAVTGPAIVACSALKLCYRDYLRSRIGLEVRFALLDAPRAALEKRLSVRRGHFMPPTLLESQFATLEPPKSDEPGTIVIDATLPPAFVLTLLRQANFLAP
jgi:gluconokinase